MKRNILSIKTISTILILAVLFASCNLSKTKPAAADKPKADTVKKQEGIAEITPLQMKTVGIELGIIEQQNLNSAVRANGILSVPPQNKAVVNALVGGVIRKINVVEGQSVQKGQVVVAIENPDFIRLQQDYLMAKDNIVYLQQEYERQKTLKDADAGIGKVYQQASAGYAAEQSKIRTLEAQLRQIHIDPAGIIKGKLQTEVPVVAPISGTVGKINLSVGTYTDAASPIMDIVNNSTLYADLQVFEKDIPKVKAGQEINFSIANQPDKKVSGRVYGINKSLDGANKSVIAHAMLNKTAGLNLVAGQYVTALIATGKQLVSAVPKEAIVKANDKTYIFVFEGTEKEPVKKDADSKDAGAKSTQEKYRFKLTEVVTGTEEMGLVEIRLLDELKPGTKIVTKGAFYIYSSMQNIETDDM